LSVRNSGDNYDNYEIKILKNFKLANRKAEIRGRKIRHRWNEDIKRDSENKA
jgi:hypothetical protein